MIVWAISQLRVRTNPEKSHEAHSSFILNNTNKNLHDITLTLTWYEQKKSQVQVNESSVGKNTINYDNINIEAIKRVSSELQRWEPET